MLEIELRTSPITNVKAEVLFNSSNGALIHGSGTAADISKASGELSLTETVEYVSIVEQMSGSVGRVYRELWELTQEDKYHKPTKLQLECAKFFLSNNGTPIKQGEIFLTSSGDLADKKGATWIIHAIAMTYDYNASEKDESGRPPIVPASSGIIKTVVSKSLELIRDKNLGNSVAFPIMCVRKGSVTALESFSVIKESVTDHAKAGTVINRVVIVGDNPQTSKFLEEMGVRTSDGSNSM